MVFSEGVKYLEKRSTERLITTNHEEDETIQKGKQKQYRSYAKNR